jgi:hypothetical protein
MAGSKIHHQNHRFWQEAHHRTGRGASRNEVCQAQVLVELEPAASVLVAALVGEGLEEVELEQGLVHQKDNHTCHCSTSFQYHIS